MEHDDFFVYPHSQTLSNKASLDFIGERIKEHLRFFKTKKGMGPSGLFSYLQFSLSNQDVLFRKRFDANDVIVNKWLSSVYQRALFSVGTLDPITFNSIDKSFLQGLAKLSPDPSILVELPAILIKYGIILVYEPALDSLKADGVAFRLLEKYLVIGLSFRYSRLDNFWFTLLHELAHASLHLSALDYPKVFDISHDVVDIQEKAANKLAKVSFVEKHIWANCAPRYERTSESIVRFSKEQGIHPAIVAGMLQREENSYQNYRDLVDQVNTRMIVFGYE